MPAPNPDIIIPNPLLGFGIESFPQDFKDLGDGCPVKYLEQLKVYNSPDVVGMLKAVLVQRKTLDPQSLDIACMGGDFMYRLVEQSELPLPVFLQLSPQGRLLTEEVSRNYAYEATFNRAVTKISKIALAQTQEVGSVIDDFWQQYRISVGIDPTLIYSFKFGAGLTAEQCWRAVGEVLGPVDIEPTKFAEEA